MFPVRELSFEEAAEEYFGAKNFAPKYHQSGKNKIFRAVKKHVLETGCSPAPLFQKSHLCVFFFRDKSHCRRQRHRDLHSLNLHAKRLRFPA
jgi:hypothetical protein